MRSKPERLTGSAATKLAVRYADLARNVAANVLANIIAAALIYLAAVAGGLLPKDPEVIIFATSVAGVTGLVLAAAIWLGTKNKAARLGARYVTAAGLLLAVTPFAAVPVIAVIRDWEIDRFVISCALIAILLLSGATGNFRRAGMARVELRSSRSLKAVADDNIDRTVGARRRALTARAGQLPRTKRRASSV